MLKFAQSLKTLKPSSDESKGDNLGKTFFFDFENQF